MFEQTRRFPCVSCQQIITDRVAECPYCHAPVDQAVAQAAADTQDRVNQAYSDASFLRSTTIGMWILLALSLLPLPFLSLLYYGFVFTFVVVVVLFVRWQMRFGKINTTDPDFAKAKRNKNVSLALLIVALPGGFIVVPLLQLLIAQLLG